MKLKECVKYLSRGKSPQYIDKSDIAVINQACIYWDGLRYEKVKYLDPESNYHEYLVRDKDVLVNSTGTGTLGRAAVYHKKEALMVADSHVTIVRVDQQKIIPEFFKYYLQYHRTQDSLYSKCVNGSTNQIELSKEKFLNFNIPDIEIKKQLAIVDQLDAVGRLCYLRTKEIEKYDDLIKARFVELFGDPVSNPKGWEKKALSEEAEIKIGPFGSLLHKEDYITGGHALVNPSHIVDGKIAPDDKLTISDEKYNELSAYHLRAGDVVLGRRGEMGRCAVVEQSGLLCGTGSLLIRTNGDLSADYIQKIISFPSC